jgi:hypothetical protein
MIIIIIIIIIINWKDLLQKTAVLATSHITRKVLQCEAWSLSGGDHSWLKRRSTREKRHVARNNNNNNNIVFWRRRSQWPSGLRRGPTAARLLGLRVWIPPEAWMFVCWECCVFSGRGLCDGLITRPEESYRLCCVIVCDLETSRMRRLKPASGL